MIETLGSDFARRLRDVERAGRLRTRLYAATFEAEECARLARYSLRDRALASAFARDAAFFLTLYNKVCRLQARARGEATDGE